MFISGKPHTIPYRRDELVQQKCPQGIDSWNDVDLKNPKNVTKVKEYRFLFVVSKRFVEDLGRVPCRAFDLTGLQVEDLFSNVYGPKLALYRSDPNHWYDFREPVSAKKRGEFRILEHKVGTEYNQELKFCCGKRQFQKIMDHYMNSKVKPHFIVGVKGKDRRTKKPFVHFYRIVDINKIRRVLIKKSPGPQKKMRVT